MLLCGVLCTALSMSFGGIVQIVIFLLQNSNISRVQASLPPGAEDEIILIEHLPGRRVHLQDFFWTDAEDAPSWVDPSHHLTFYETKTIRHTVTIYSPVDEKEDRQPIYPHRSDSPKCTTCIEPTPRVDDNEDQNIGVLIEGDPGPRYWLLTVLRAGEAVPSEIELRLARLYRTAFLRQQQRHLGLLQTNPRPRRTAEERTLVKRKPDISTSQEEILENSASSPARLSVQPNPKSQILTLTESIKVIEVSKPKNVNDIENYNESIQVGISFPPKNLNVEDDALLYTKSAVSSSKFSDKNENETDRSSEQYFQDKESRNFSSNLQNSSDRHPILEKLMLNDSDTESLSASKHSGLRSLDYSAEETVQVRMQNMSVIEGGATQLIYSVHLGGKPVFPETAARDMSLLSPQEVALELGAPILIQSEPYLKETRPLALSRKRDAWLLIGAASAGFLLLALVLLGLIVAAKRKRAHSAVAAPLKRSVLKEEQDYVPAPVNLDSAAFLVPEMEVKTDGTSQRQISGSLSRILVTPESPDGPNAKIYEDSNENDGRQKRKAREPNPWEHPSNKTKLGRGRILWTNVVDTPRTVCSSNAVADHFETFESLKNSHAKQEEDEATASPHSYLSMPSCKQFPSMKTVEPLSRILEPSMVKHLDIDSPELLRGNNGHIDACTENEVNDTPFSRTTSATKDPGVVGPIVWSLRKQALSSEGNDTSEIDGDPMYNVPAGPVGRAKRRFHELLEDSFSLFGSRNPKSEVQQSAPRKTSIVCTPDVLTVCSETNGSTLSPVLLPSTEIKPRSRTSLPPKLHEENIAKTEHSAPAQSRGAWSSRPLSAGPFHRPHLPDIDTERIFTDCQLTPEDPAVPLITSIKKELDKFSSQ